MIVDGKIKQLQFDVVCHACGTKNSIVLCSDCGRLNNTIYAHCYYCGLALENPDNVEKSSTCDEIMFDYDSRPLVTETGSVLDYIAAMVRRVRERASRMGFEDTLRFTFKLSPKLWEEISALYSVHPHACGENAVPGGFAGPLWAEEIWEKQAELKAKQSIFVDGIEYSVELDKNCGSDIFFAPQEDRGPLTKRFLTAILKKVGIG